MMRDNQSRLYEFLKDREASAATFTTSDAAAASGLKISSVETYLSKRLRPRFVSGVQEKDKTDLLRAHGFVNMSETDFLRFMSQKPVLPGRSWSDQQFVPAQNIAPTYFADLHATGLSFGTVVDAYFDWMEGTGAFVKKAADRRAQGVPEHLDHAAVLRGDQVRFGPGCEVSARSSDGEVLLRFIHRDAAVPDATWWSVVRLRAGKSPSTVQIEHATGRLAPAQVSAPQTGGAPTILRELLNMPGAGVLERDINLFKPRVVGPDAVKAYLDHDLLDHSRVLPHLVVSGDVQRRAPRLRLDRLARLLGTQVVVVSLRDDATGLFAQELARRGYSAPELGVADGAARLYQLDLVKNRQPGAHPVWTATHLEALTAELAARAVERVAAEVAARIVWRAIPPRFFSIVDDWDRRQRNAAADALLHATWAKAASDAERIAAQAGEIDCLRKALQQAKTERDVLELERDHLTQDVWEMREKKEVYKELLMLAEGERDAAKEESAQAGTDRFNLQKQLDALQLAQPSDFKLSAAQRDALAKLLPQRLDLETAVSVVATLFPDRLVVLPSAWQAARAAAAFRYTERAFSLMVTLATDYWISLQNGGDAAARGVFGNAYAANESETVKHRKEAQDRRTFVHEGKPIVMERHLKIGVKDSIAETWRLHFEPIDAKIVIGHCGKHLDFD